MIRRLSNLGASEPEMLDVYQKQVRSVLEMAVPVWQAGLTQQEMRQIERVQRTAFYVILGDKYLSYKNALGVLKAETLSDRRHKLCENFVKKAALHPKFQNWFVPNQTPDPNFKTRGGKVKDKNMYQPVKTRTDRYEHSPLPYLTNILNEVMQK